MSKSEQLAELYSKYKNEYMDREVVFGEGNIDCEILLVGEAPGKDEVRLSKPFVGTAGKNLSEFLNILGQDRSDIYITNTIKYRLSKVNPKTQRLVNRPTTKEEIKLSREYLVHEVSIIKPKYIVTLGNVPLKAVFDDYSINIGSLHGTLKPVHIHNEEYNVYALYHPASIIYNNSLKVTYLEDLEKLKEIISNI